MVTHFWIVNKRYTERTVKGRNAFFLWGAMWLDNLKISSKHENFKKFVNSFFFGKFVEN